MATYVNDLRLKEIATGDESGTWGTSTNTNLELIANAMGVGAEAIANASTHTITMADGTADEFRSTFLRLTGGGTACTVTLAPNTLSHTWIMRNETAAVLTLTQGSGANVAIAAGQTKIVATDGAGSGAIVYEMDDLELAGNLVTGALTVDTNTLVVDATNNRVGIGSTTVNRKLEVAGNNNGGAKANYIRITDTDTTATANNQAGGIEFFTNDVTPGIAASIEVLYAGTGGGGEITFNTNASSSGTLTEALRIDESGNVGIGQAPSAFSSWRILELKGGTAGAMLNFENSSSTRVSSFAYDDASDSLRIQNFLANPIAFETNNTERMRLDASGNLLVGTTASGSEGLNLSNGVNLGFSEGANSSLVNLFRQTSSGSTFLGSGYRYSDTANKAESSWANAWARSAITVGYADVEFFVDAEATVAVGTDITPTKRVTIGVNGMGIGQIDSTSGALTIQANSGAGGIAIVGRASGGIGGIGFYDDNGTTGVGYIQGRADDAQLRFWGQQSNGTVSIGQNNTERLQITATGLVYSSVQYIGGFGAQTTSGTTNFNDASNALSGNGFTLLRGDATNGPGGTAYYHVFNYEYVSKNGTGNMTQLIYGYNDNKAYMRYRLSGSWSAWAALH